MKKKIYIDFMLSFILSVGLATCTNDNLKSSRIDFQIESGKNIFVLTTDYTSGFLSVLNVGTRNVQNDIVSLHTDGVLRQIGGSPDIYIINRYLGDNIIRIEKHDNKNYGIAFEESVGTSANPYDISQLKWSLGVVALYNRDHLQFINLKNGRIGQIEPYDLSRYRISDRGPGTHALIRYNGYVYVSMQALGNDWCPTKNGKLIRMDIDSLAVTELDDMPKQNPSGDFQFYQGKLGGSTNHDWLLLTTVGKHRSGFCSNNDTNDGAVIAYQIPNGPYKVILTEEQSEYMDIAVFRIVSDTRGFALLTGSGYNLVSLVEFNPSTGGITYTFVSQANLADSLVYDGGKIYVGDRTPTNPGIRVFDTNRRREETDRPISVGLPPYDLLLVEP